MSDDNAARKAWLSVLAKAPSGQVAALLEQAVPRPEFEWLRRPEIGSTMVRARAGATGAPFNLGEMTVTRCALKITSGEVGHAYIQGRNRTDAEAVALTDALMQTDAAEAIQRDVLDPIAQAQQAAKANRATKAAATKVDFFTMVRGHD